MLARYVTGTILCSIFLLGYAATTASPTDAAIAACQGQVRARKAKAGPQVAVVQPALICFSGNIDGASAEPLIRAIEEIPEADPLTLVIEGSDGGDVASGLDIAEALSRRDSTVIAKGLCASSCANYLWLMADHRIIAEGGLLIFHGGATMALLPDMYEQIEALAKAHPSMDADDVKQKEQSKLEGFVQRQHDLLTRAGVNADFFEFFDRIDSAEAGSSQSADCEALPEAKYIIFSPRYLESKGVHISVDRGPRTASQVHEYLKTISQEATEGTCFWD